MKKILIVGATSAIAQATARLWAEAGSSLYLLARDEERLAALAADLKIRGARSVHWARFEANDFEQHPGDVDAAIAKLEGLDTVLIAHGTLSDQQACERDFEQTLRELNTNALSAISLLTHLGNRFEAQRHGTIAIIGSVAGDRGRQSNYVYGAAKGMVGIFAQGLRNRLDRHGVHVLTIKPGWVDTPMTMKLPKGSPLWVGPEVVARSILRAIQKRKDVAYTPVIWWAVMLVIRLIPESLFKKMRL